MTADIQGLLIRARGHARKRELDRAAAAYRTALERDPACYEAWIECGGVALQRNDAAEAEACFGKAVALRPDVAHGHYWLGVARFTEPKRWEEAEQAFRQAVAIDPGQAVYWNDLGVVEQQRGKLKEAADAYREVVRLEPGHAKARYNLSLVYQRLKRLEEARTELNEAVKTLDNEPDVHGTLAKVLQELRDHEEAERHARRALELKPGHREAVWALAGALRSTNRLIESERVLTDALALDPDFTEGWIELGGLLLDHGRAEEADHCWREILRIGRDCLLAQTNLLLTAHYWEGLSPQQVFEEHRRWETLFWEGNGGEPARAAAQAMRPVLAARPRAADRRLRVGYVSADLGRHPVGWFLWGVLPRHDRSRVSITLYSSNEAPDDPVTQRFMGFCDHWRDVRELSEAGFLQRIRDDRIDVLIDLSGHTGGHQLSVFAQRAAPVQVSWLGYPDTTGLSAMDWRIVDDVSDPPDQPWYGSERPWRLPRPFLAYTAPVEVAPASHVPVRDNGFITFGSFNNIAKLSPRSLDLWSAVLRRVPDSKLLLKWSSYADSAIRARVESEFARRGIETGRLELVTTKASTAEHLRTYDRIDIALDPTPYNGTTTTCELLWMGVPMIALRGDRHCSRVGASILTGIGHAEWVAEDDAQWVEKMVALTTDTDALDRLRAGGLRDQMAASPLCDGADMARHFEEAWAVMRDEAG